MTKENGYFDTSLIRILQNELLEKNNQLAVKDHQIESLQENISELTSEIENLTKFLNSSQALHAGTMQQTFLSDTQPESFLKNEEKIEEKDVSNNTLEKIWFRFFKK